MQVQGHVTYSKRESHHHIQTIDTRTPLIGSTPKTKQKISAISIFLISLYKIKKYNQ